MNKPLLLALSALCLTGAARPTPASEVKFGAPGDNTRLLSSPTAAETLSITADDGGALRFTSADKKPLCRADISPGGKGMKEADGEVGVTFRFGEEAQSFGLYVRVSGEADPAYLALVSISNDGLGRLRFFKVAPGVQVGDEHQLATANFRNLHAGDWYTLKIRTTTGSGSAVTAIAEVAPVKGGEATSVTATDPSGINAGGVQLRFFAPDTGRHIDVQRVATSPAGKSAGR